MRRKSDFPSQFLKFAINAIDSEVIGANQVKNHKFISDYLFLTNHNTTIEVEQKADQGDLLSDFNKSYAPSKLDLDKRIFKHDLLKSGELNVNNFYFLIDEKLDFNSIPALYGIITYKETPKGVFFNVIRNAQYIHTTKDKDGQRANILKRRKRLDSEITQLDSLSEREKAEEALQQDRYEKRIIKYINDVLRQCFLISTHPVNTLYATLNTPLKYSCIFNSYIIHVDIIPMDLVETAVKIYFDSRNNPGTDIITSDGFLQQYIAYDLFIKELIKL